MELCVTERFQAVESVWASGPLLEGDSVAGPDAVVRLDVPADELPWRVTPAAGEPLVAAVTHHRLPVSLLWRSVHAPVWNHIIVRPALLWSADGGAADKVAATLLRGPVPDELRLEAPAPDALRRQLEAELEISHRAL